MFAAGVNSSSGNSLAVENECSYDIPEWKKLLIMKKRAGNSPNVIDDRRTNLDSGVNIANRNGGCSNTCDSFAAGGTANKFGRSAAKVAEQDLREISPPKTVTIGNINVELRSVKSTSENHSLADVPGTEWNRNSNGDLKNNEFTGGEDGQDLQYGPGIVDRLRAKFLNLGAKQQSKPVVRRFSSLENLPGSNTGPYRVNARGGRQNGFKYGTGHYVSGHVKKAQSMETLICTTPEQQIFASSRRPNARYVGGVKGRILSKNNNISPISVVTDENDEPDREKSPSPAASPRLFTKSIRRWDYNRSISASNINEDELPKPDTVKHVKKIFESPPNSSEKSASARFRKAPTPTPLSNGAIVGSAWTAVKEEEDSLPAKTCAKESLELHIPKEEFPLSLDDYKINKAGYSPVLGENLSVNRSCDYTSQDDVCSTPEEVDVLEEEEEASENDASILEDVPDLGCCKVTAEQLPLEEVDQHYEALFQGSQVAVFDQVERPEEDIPPRPAGVSPDSMVVAAGDGSGAPVKKGPSTWQKAPQATTSIVFDFRGKDVKPNISLNPTPFGCRPAKVARSKRTGSPPRTNGEVPDSPEDEEASDAEDEDWDEMDIGADLPAHSGIVFVGENVKVGKGALLEKRNKKLSLTFDTETLTIEFPPEWSPDEEDNSIEDPVLSSTRATGIASEANSRLGNYTPLVLTSNNDFQLGITQSNHRPSSLLEATNKDENSPVSDAITPTNPDDAEGFSATESDDMLF